MSSGAHDRKHLDTQLGVQLGVELGAKLGAAVVGQGVEGCEATGTTGRAAISTAVMTDDSGVFSGLILPACFVAILFDVVPLSIEIMRRCATIRTHVDRTWHAHAAREVSREVECAVQYNVSCNTQRGKCRTMQ